MVNKPNTKNKVKEQKNEAAGSEKTAKKKFKRTSEYGRQLEEKQKVKRSYGLREKQFRNLFGKATRMEGAPGENLLSLLERRLDNAVFRLKMTISARQARQVIVHGHILVNGKKVTAPAYLTSPGDVISLEQNSLKKEKFLSLNSLNRLSIFFPDKLE